MFTGKVQPAVRDALGTQFTGLWASGLDLGIDVGFAPGTLDEAPARAAILDRFAAVLTPDQLATATRLLHVVPEPYSEADLTAAGVGAVQALQAAGFNVTESYISCVDDALRVSLAAYTGGPDPSADAVQTAAAAVAPFGDKVRFRFITQVAQALVGVVPAVPQPKPPIVGGDVSLARASRCVHGKAITVKARKAADLQSLVVAVRGHKARLGAGRSTRVALARRTRVTLTVTLRNGATATQAYSFTRC